jgi:hypothetical protein
MGRLVSPRFHHGPIDIIQHDRSGRVQFLYGQDGEIACPAAHVDDKIPCMQSQLLDGNALPEIMDAKAKKGIHQIVLLGDGIEMIADKPVFFLGRTFRNPK